MEFSDYKDNLDNVINDEVYNEKSVSSLYDTINDKLSFAPIIEDISYFCDKCKEFIYYGDISLHRRIHDCLEVFQIINFQGLTSEILAKRRSKFAKYLKTYPDEQKRLIMMKVDDAYLTIYNYLIEERHQELQWRHFIADNKPHRYGPNKSLFQNTESRSLSSDTLVGFDIGFAVTSRSKIGGPSVVTRNISDNIVCFAIVTAVDGKCAEKYVSENFLQCLALTYNICEEDSLENNRLSVAIEKSFVEIDKKLSTGLYDNTTFKSWSSCCVELLVVSRVSQNLYQVTVANIGDGRVILVDKHDVIQDKINNYRGSGDLLINQDTNIDVTTTNRGLLGGYGRPEKESHMPESKCYRFDWDSDRNLGIIVLNREVSRHLSNDDAAHIFKCEMKVPQDLWSGTRSIIDSSSDITTDNLFECISSEMSSLGSAPECGSQRLGDKVEEMTAVTVAKKIVNASVLCSRHDCDLGCLVLVANNLDNN